MNIIDDWYKQKINAPCLRLNKAVEIREKYQVHTGGRSIFAEICLSAEPNDTFRFESKVKWPDEGHEDTYDTMVLHGLLDIFFTYTDTPILGMSIVLKEIGWNDKESCGIGYYRAARIAAEKIIHPAADEWNFD
jgi:hypothetical protein